MTIPIGLVTTVGISAGDSNLAVSSCLTIRMSYFTQKAALEPSGVFKIIDKKKVAIPK
jgi:hypothetical protein